MHLTVLQWACLMCTNIIITASSLTSTEEDSPMRQSACPCGSSGHMPQPQGTIIIKLLLYLELMMRGHTG